MTQWFKEVHPMMVMSSTVCSFLFILFQWSKILLLIKYYNWVRDKTKGYVFSLRVVFDDIWCMYESSLFIEEITLNNIKYIKTMNKW